jgi:glycosyltransferase involved in cell wall biosynthesis
MVHKVSIVVPIYKVERYLRRCVDSLLNQTYSNIEIILVDDGSPDNCGKIADQYAKKDPRVKVVHKKNGGLSDARNYGMQYVTGEFTLFVDSDDWLDYQMIQNMVTISVECKADAVQSAFYYAYDDYLLFDNRYGSKDDSPIVLGNKLLMSELIINERVKNFAWGKLYKTELIREIPFKKGVLFEDVFWTHQVMHRIKKYVIQHQPMYYYYQRSDSIVANYTTRNLDIIKGLKERHSFIQEQYQELTNQSYKEILKACLIHYNLLLINRQKDHGGMCKKEIQRYIKDNYPEFKRAVENDRQLSQQLLLYRIHPYLNVIFLIMRKGLRGLRILSQPTGLERIDIN